MTDRSRWIRAAGATVVAAGILLSTAAPATAAGAGDWYFDALHIQAAHDAGFTGEGVTIAVLDGAVDPSTPGLADADITAKKNSYCYDEAGKVIPAVTTAGEASMHATNIALYLAGNGAPIRGAATQRGVAPDAKLLMYAVVSPKTGDRLAENEVQCLTKAGKESDTNVADAITDAVDDGADIITISLSVAQSEEAIAAIAYALHNDVAIFGSLRNDLFQFEAGDFPVAANGVVGVQAVDSNAHVATTDLDGATYENNSMDTDISAPGVSFTGLRVGDTGLLDKVTLISGTSFATPMTAGFLSLVKQKYPEATTNQLLQSLIRNSNGETHEPYWDKVAGYGVVSATAMLAADPVGYADTNPFIIDDGVYRPAPWQINGEPNPDAAVDNSWMEKGEKEDAARQEKLQADIVKLALIVGVPFAAATIAGVVILILVVTRRKKRKPATKAAPSPWDSFPPQPPQDGH
ncbi:S8 family peptidase [Leifsonia sp. Leaf264]|uniref:S8 family peptidase n=1 Tax=Leifsonia sp. Leaf264 TaxID=1736314 RepID=UPI0006FEE406|nr:S8 family serine peptidase [Leifsonia sp. Leaf264]KQO98427.1 hypothetical protein ASF30_10220 [Leifsonia sp. Leaf264]